MVQRPAFAAKQDSISCIEVIEISANVTEHAAIRALKVRNMILLRLYIALH